MAVVASWFFEIAIAPVVHSHGDVSSGDHPHPRNPKHAHTLPSERERVRVDFRGGQWLNPPNLPEQIPRIYLLLLLL